MSSRDQAYDLYKADLIKAGFTTCEYNKETDSWLIVRNSYIGKNKDKLIKKVFTISNTSDIHPYGKDQSYKVISFRYNNRSVNTTLARFIWAWEYGNISSSDIIKHVGPDFSIQSYKKQNKHDHTGYIKSNQYLCIKEIVKQAIEDYEKTGTCRFKF